MIVWGFALIFYKSICCGYLFELHQQVDSNGYPQHMLYKEVDKKYTGYNLKTIELLDYVLMPGMCSN